MTKRKRTKLLTGCHKCSGTLTRISGFVTCTKCGHVHSLFKESSAYADKRPRGGQMLGSTRIMPTHSEPRTNPKFLGGPVRRNAPMGAKGRAT